jgi:hypothetical protein
MIVWMDDDLFAAPARDVDRLALLRNAALRRHTLIVSTHPDRPRGARTSPKFDAWLSALPERLRLEIAMLRERTDRVSVNAVTRGATRVLVTSHARDGTYTDCRLSLEDAVRAVSQPLHILVEHQVNDAAFLRRIMPPAWRRRLETWERHGELRYDNGGGISVMAALIDFHREDRNAGLAFGLPTDMWRLLHFVVYDHDGEECERPGEGSRLLEKACAEAGMGDRAHRLERRDQEHYLPVEVLRQILEDRIIDPREREKRLADIDGHVQKGDRRHFAAMPDLFKNAFAREGATAWPDDWFERDGAWSEMTRLAERIASAM